MATLLKQTWWAVLLEGLAKDLGEGMDEARDDLKDALDSTALRFE